MASSIVTTGTQIMCNHQSPATSSKPSSRVKIANQPVVLQAPPLAVGSCPAKLPSPGGPVPAPCVVINFSAPTTRVKIEGMAALIESSVGTCVGPLGAAASILPGQQRVKGIRCRSHIHIR